MPRFGQGKPAAHPQVFEIAPLTQSDIDNFVPSAEEQGTVKKLRDSHHRIAHLFAAGYRNNEIHEITGYSVVRLSTLRASPAMKELVELYRKDVVIPQRQTEIDHKFHNINRLHALAAGEMIDRFEDEDQREKISNGQLVAIISDTADRIGYPKRRESVNLDKDFASRLDRAINRADSAKLINGEVVPNPPSNPNPQQVLNGGGLGASERPPQPMLPVPLRRRA